MSRLIDNLNPEQLEAVTFPSDRPLKVIAGAGTGKTTILVGRFQHFVRDCNIPAENLLALTFTNKAAAEMLDRVRKEVPEVDPLNSWVTTFHAFALRLLKAEALTAGLDPGFTIMDEVGCRLLFERVCRKLLAGKLQNSYFQADRIQELRFTDGALLSNAFHLINQLKDAAIEPQEFINTCLALDPDYNRRLREAIDSLPGKRYRKKPKILEQLPGEEQYGSEAAGLIYTLYLAYQEELAKNRALDFGDLIARACRVLKEHPERRQYYQRKFHHILIDEFQDTSTAQYQLVELLSRDNMRNVTIVGDDKQSIYGWRNAKVENVRLFDPVPRGGKTLTVKRNYRSFGEILSLATAAIRRSSYFAGRPDELELIAEKFGFRKQATIFVYEAQREAEATFIAAQIKELLAAGRKPEDIVILMRSLNPAKAYEDALLQEGIPYQTFGGIGFYDREEIMDILSYLRLVEDPLDEMALIRVLSRPPFAVNDRFLAEVAAQGRRGGSSSQCSAEAMDEGGETAAPAAAPEEPEFLVKLEATLTKNLDDSPGLADSPGCREGLVRARELLRQLASLHKLRDLIMPQELITRVLKDTGYLSYLRSLPAPAQARSSANLEKLAALAAEFTRANPGAALSDFLTYINAAITFGVVEGEADIAAPAGNAVKLMTIHKSKGLEFPVVFVAGIGPTRFPPNFKGNAFSFIPEIGLVVRKSAPIGDNTQKYAPYYFDKHRDHYESAGICCPEMQAREAVTEEERRLWYVALTRAKELLFLSGTMRTTKLRQQELEAAKAGMAEAAETAEKAEAAKTAETAEAEVAAAAAGTAEAAEAAKAAETEDMAQTAQGCAADPQGDFLAEAISFINDHAAEQYGAILTDHGPQRFTAQESAGAVDGAAGSGRECGREGDGGGDGGWLLSLHSLESIASVPAAAQYPPYVNLSFSAIRIFLHCPQRYYYLYRWRFPGDRPTEAINQLGYDPALLGSAVHMALENTRKSGKYGADDYIDEFRKACQELGINKQTCEAAYLPLAQEWLTQFAASSLGQPLDGEIWEKPFALEWPVNLTTVRFKGFIDQLVPRQNGRWDVLDYKTNRVLGPEEIRDYTLQLQLYALACRQGLGLEIENLYLYHFPKGTLLKIEEDAQTAADILTKVGDAIAAGVTEIDFRWPDRGCRHCPVAICPLRDEEKTEVDEEAVQNDEAAQIDDN